MGRVTNLQNSWVLFASHINTHKENKWLCPTKSYQYDTFHSFKNLIDNHHKKSGFLSWVSRFYSGFIQTVHIFADCELIVAYDARVWPLVELLEFNCRNAIAGTHFQHVMMCQLFNSFYKLTNQWRHRMNHERLKNYSYGHALLIDTFCQCQNSASATIKVVEQNLRRLCGCKIDCVQQIVVLQQEFHTICQSATVACQYKQSKLQSETQYRQRRVYRIFKKFM